MLYCSHCERRFFDGELMKVRDVNGTEVPMHGECFDRWLAAEADLARLFGHDFNEGLIETFERFFFDHQILV